MARQNSGKLNQLQKLLENVVVTTRSLAVDGYSRQLVAQYLASGWLEKVGPGAYRLPSKQPLNWERVIYSLQLLKLPFYAGGESALFLSGHTHQLQLSSQAKVHIYGVGKLPEWVRSALPNVRVQHHGHKIFDEPASFWTLENPTEDISLTGWEWVDLKPWDLPLVVSSPERAWLEVLHGVSKDVGFDEVDELSSGLRTLRPKLMETLLQRSSIKVRRLAFWLGERHQHHWVSKVEPALINLGSGKRALSPGGRLVKKYGITVPKHLVNHD